MMEILYLLTIIVLTVGLALLAQRVRKLEKLAHAMAQNAFHMQTTYSKEIPQLKRQVEWLRVYGQLRPGQAHAKPYPGEQ